MRVFAVFFRGVRPLVAVGAVGWLPAVKVSVRVGVGDGDVDDNHVFNEVGRTAVGQGPGKIEMFIARFSKAVVSKGERSLTEARTFIARRDLVRWLTKARY